jgi:peptide/nickel transport system substrate-binding protein
MDRLGYWTALPRMRQTRRRLMRGALMTGAGLAGVALLGCSTRKSTSGGSASPAGAGQATPKRGGVLRLSMDRDPGGLDVQQATDIQGLQMLEPLYSQVLRQVPNDWGKLQGDLATKWEPSADGLTWTFTLRQDAKWHDGQPVTADDVVYSLNRMINPPPGFRGGNAGDLRAAVASVAKLDAATLTVRLKRPAVAFLQALAMPYTRILPQHVLQPIDANEQSRALKVTELIGSGPFRFKSYERGSTWVLERNPDYYLTGQPYLDGLTFYIIPDDNTRLESLIAGRLDMERPSESLTPSLSKQLQSQGGDRYTLKTGSNARFTGLFFNTSVAPFQDVRLRRAVHLALDRQQMIQLMQEGQGLITPPLTSFDFVYPIDHYLALPGYRPDKTADLAQAKQLVDAATGGKGLDATFTVAAIPPYPNFLQLEVQQLTKIGIRVNIQSIENATAEAHYNAGQETVIGAHPCAVPYNDPDSMIARYFLPDGARYWSKWAPPEFTDLYTKESVDLNQSTRAKTLQQMVDILEQELPAIALTDSLRAMPLSKKIGGYDVVPPSANSDTRFDWIWLASG